MMIDLSAEATSPRDAETSGGATQEVSAPMPDKPISRFKKTGRCTLCNAPCSPRAKHCAECERQSRLGKNAGPDNPNWKGGRNLTPTGYVRVKRVGHPAADATGNVLEHRIVVEAALGRYLRTDEHVHHVNGDKTDNRPENLRVVSPAEHRLLHARLSDEQILESLRRGQGVSEIARTHRVSWRRVRRLAQ